MAQRVEIKCINKTDRYNAHERIQNIGGTNADGSRWKMTVSYAITKIEDGTYSFYINRGGASVDVIVASNNGTKYLKTKNDGLQPDNLLSLPECPA